MVFNDSRVRKARVYGTLDAGKPSEFLLVRKSADDCWLAQTQKTKRKRVGQRYDFGHGMTGEIAANDGEFVTLRFTPPLDDSWLDQWGHVPLPPYLSRADEALDSERYQTVYARETGSAAAPTAGLHFTSELLQKCQEGGAEEVFVTLHVGLGTFLPVRSENIEEHKMHEESWTITDSVADKIEAARGEGRPILAVGTTSLRTLESACQHGKIRRGSHSTSIFIYPPYSFKAVTALFTNFHTPESTLLMLVSAFAGKDLIMRAYHEAIEQRYHFFSYGDAMLVV
jgi:S-adenosylmethionine:tRNA ribosyltransferase-isomerase